MAFQEKDITNLTKLLKNIMKRPCANIFLELFDPLDNNFENYYELINNPIDLSIILNRLENNFYFDLNQFKKDFYLIFFNSFKFFGKDHFITYLASHLIFIFEKKLNKLVLNDLNKWEKQYYLFSKSLEKKIKKFKGEEEEIIIPKKKILNKNIISKITFTNLEIANFLVAIGKLTTIQDAKDLTMIIIKNQPDLNLTFPNVKLNIEELNEFTLQEMINFTKKRYKDLKLIYPE